VEIASYCYYKLTLQHVYHRFAQDQAALVRHAILFPIPRGHPHSFLCRLDRSRSQRILWLLEELKLPYELEIYHRDKATNFAPPELEKVHPLGKSPVVTVQASDATTPLVLAESGFITQYLVEHSPEGKRLMPTKWKEGMEGKFGGETEEWMRYQYYLHYVEGSFMPVLILSLFIGGKFLPSRKRLGIAR
jgi:glutathione S-transferase